MALPSITLFGTLVCSRIAEPLGRSGGDMSRTKGRTGGRLLAEFAVIILGVLGALAADRWMVGVEEASLGDAYLARLRTDFRADSAAIEERIAHTEENVGRVGLLLSVWKEGPDASAARTDVLVAVETLAWWRPVQYATGTWTDLLATGNLRLIDSDLRGKLSSYYADIDDTRQEETEIKQGPFLRYRLEASRLLTPEQRLLATFVPFGRDPTTISSIWDDVGFADPGIEVSAATTLSDDRFAALIGRIQESPDLEALLSDVLMGSVALYFYYNELLQDVAELLAEPRLKGLRPNDR